ncbi:MAG TPA: VWA domain-containing protein, partial [Rhodospirillales bacterium]|nr:VWA domain-containing protein [Rhodospirillales bacterium]
MADNKKNVPDTQKRDLARGKASASEIDAFLDKLSRTPVMPGRSGRGRLIFALDATASRQAMWDRAAKIQGEMFVETANLGGLDLQLAFYRGFGEFKVSNWISDGKQLAKLMTSVFCLAGETQIGKVLSHAANQTERQKVNAVVFVGDCIEEDVD